MTYQMRGLAAAPFSAYTAMTDEELSAIGARRVVATADRGFPCRVRLDDARRGTRLILLNYVSHDVPTPYRTAYAIYVDESAQVPAHYSDEPAPYLVNRALSLRAFGGDDMIVTARLAAEGEADFAIRQLFAMPEVTYVMAHFAAYGCFAARIDRKGDTA